MPETDPLDIDRRIAEAIKRISKTIGPHSLRWWHLSTDTPSPGEGVVYDPNEPTGLKFAVVGSPGAPVAAQYLVLALHADLTGERRLVDGTGLTGADGGANGDYTLACDLATGAVVGIISLAAQTLGAGVKTFTSIPVLPASNPTAANQAARKAYVDLMILKSLLTTRGDMIRRGASAPERFAKGTSGKLLEMGANDPDWQWSKAGIEYVIDGGGSAIPTGSAGGLVVPFKCFVTGWTVHATGGQTGAITIDVNYHATTVPATSSIAGSEKPNIASGSEGEDLTLTTWTQALAKGGSLVFDVDSNGGSHERVVVCLYVDKQRAS